MKKAVFIIACVFFLIGTPLKAFAAEGYAENYESAVGDTFDGLLDGDTRDLLRENGLDPADENWISSLNAQGVFEFILSLVRGDIKKPFTAFLSITALIFVFSAFSSFGSERAALTAEAASVAAVAAIVTADVFSCVSAAAEAVRGCSAFMIGFIPAFVSLVAAGGRVATSSAAGATLLFAANAVSSFASQGVLPLMGGYLGVSMVSGVSPLISRADPAAALKKATMWVLSLTTTIFLGVLSLQTAVTSAADNLNLKTAKFVLGTSVPVAGGVLAEAVTAVSSSLGLLKSSVGIYAVVALCAILLPVLTDVILWRLCFALSSVTGELFGAKKISSLLKAVDAVLACVLGIALLCAALFIISLCVLVTAGREV